MRVSPSEPVPPPSTDGSGLASQSAQAPAQPASPNASVDGFVIRNVSGTFTVDSPPVEQVQREQGTVEDVTLQNATISVDNATVVVGNAISRDSDVSNATVSIREGTVTLENATATVNGEEIQIEDRTVTVENVSTTTDSLDDQAVRSIPIDVDDLRAMLEGASTEEFTSRSASEGVKFQELGRHGVEAGGHVGGAILGDVELEELGRLTVSDGSARIEDGSLVIENVTVTMEDADPAVELGTVSMDGANQVLEDKSLRIDGPVTFTRAELRLPLS